MALSDLEIGVSRRDARLFFAFRAADGPVAATVIAVVRAEAADPVEPVWSLFPAGHAVRTVSSNLTAIGLESARGAGRKGGDPSGSGDWERMLTREAMPLPEEIAYGEVPPGFQQVDPAHGPAPPLEPGREYVLMLIGGSWGQVTFEA